MENKGSQRTDEYQEKRFLIWQPCDNQTRRKHHNTNQTRRTRRRHEPPHRASIKRTHWSVPVEFNSLLQNPMTAPAHPAFDTTVSFSSINGSKLTMPSSHMLECNGLKSTQQPSSWLPSLPALNDSKRRASIWPWRHLPNNRCNPTAPKGGHTSRRPNFLLGQPIGSCLTTWASQKGCDCFASCPRMRQLLHILQTMLHP